MNILYCGDNNIEQGLLISVLSLTEHVKEPLYIYVLTASFPTQGRHSNNIHQSLIYLLDSLVKKVNPKNFVKAIDISLLVARDYPEINLNTIFTPASMLRLFADEVSLLPDKILYLDTDIVCRRNFFNFYCQDITKLEVVGILDYYGKWFFHNHSWLFDYMNSGVMLLNIKRIKQTGLFTKARKLCKSKKMFMPDQSAINKFVTHYKLAPRRYNDQRRLHKDTVFQHFTTHFGYFPKFHTITVKPWEVDRVHSELHLHEYDDLLNRYQLIYAQHKERLK
ncbi:glycosyltransferase [Loigolactobacillus binensis]|uniref:Glycosyltransferase n=1 Tax=Loigolactobacillus binensis TaxID=2559922 RepID=A0ABW3EDV0_9LACO|nr:glycosyltransferase [Loigolactobacillus binensis]